MNNRFLRWIGRCIKALLTLFLIFGIGVLYCNLRIRTVGRARTYDVVQNVPHRHAALLLGT